MNIIDNRPVTMAEAKDIVLERENDKELSYEQKLASEHLKKFTKLKASEAKKFVGDISEVLRMSSETLVQIVNLIPKTPDELRLIFAREKFSLKEEEVQKILEIVKKYS